MTTPSTALSEAQKRMVTITTEAGDIVKYGNNPAELAGARFEMDRCLERLGAFNLLITHNAAPVGNNLIATEDLDTIPFITDLLADPNAATYTYRNPCPATPARIAATNVARTAAGQPLYNGVPRISSIPPAYLKLVSPNKYAVAVEDHAYALTQLSIFEDQVEANRLLSQCGRSGRRLRGILDALELDASGEDVTLVVGKRDSTVNRGVGGMPLSLANYKQFWLDFNVAEMKCPPTQRKSDVEKQQIIGRLFFSDPALRKAWSDLVKQNPVMGINPATGAVVRVSGAPRDFAEATANALRILRTDVVIAGIDDLSRQSTGSALSSDSDRARSALVANGIEAAGVSDEQACILAATLEEHPSQFTLAAQNDPRKNLPSVNATKEIESGYPPRGPDGKFKYWTPKMQQCDCGTPDEGYHVRYKWPCGYYRKPKEDEESPDARQEWKPKGKGKDRGKGGK